MRKFEKFRRLTHQQQCYQFQILYNEKRLFGCGKRFLHTCERFILISKSLRTPSDTDNLGKLLCKFSHRFSKHSTDLGHATVDPFRTIVQKDAQPEKQRPYRHSAILAAKVQTEIDKPVSAGFLLRSYFNWASPLVVIAKADGRIRLTCNYKRLNAQSIIIPVMPLLLPTVCRWFVVWFGRSECFQYDGFG